MYACRAVHTRATAPLLLLTSQPPPGPPQLSELELQARAPPAMLGAVPEALALGVFADDWESRILWDGADAGPAAQAGGAAAAEAEASASQVGSEKP
jgi:hypothetical protein